MASTTTPGSLPSTLPGNQARLRKAVHHHRLASKRGMLERMFTLWFRGFVYNQIWEDPRVDAEALGLGPHSRRRRAPPAGRS